MGTLIQSPEDLVWGYAFLLTGSGLTAAAMILTLLYVRVLLKEKRKDRA